jgi:membrane protease YdiL (CAAX protease family)
MAMEPYWSYEDIGAFFFVLVVLAALVRLGIRAQLLRPSDLAAPSLTLQISIIIFLGIALYAILKRRRQKPVIAPLGWVAPSAFYTLLAVVGGIALALGITLFTYAHHHVMPMIPTLDFLVLGLLLGPMLEESVFRGCLLPVVAHTFGNTLSIISTAVLFAVFHGPNDVAHWVWFTSTGIAYGWLRLASKTTTAAAFMHATYNLTLFLAAKF